MAFKKPTAPSPSSASSAGKAKKKKASRYGGIKGSQPRNPPAPVGDYRFRIAKFEEGDVLEELDGKQNIKLELEIVEIRGGGEGVKEGDIVFTSFRVAGAGSKAGLGRLKTFCVAATGYDSEEAFDDADTSGETIDALLGYDVDDEELQGITVVGELVDAKVRQGNAILTKDGDETGEFWSNYFWSPVNDEEGEAEEA